MKKQKTQTLEILAIVLIIAGIILIFVGLFIPPLGIIHSSALWALGQMFALSGSLLGVKEHYDSKLKEVKEEIKDELKDK